MQLPFTICGPLLVPANTLNASPMFTPGTNYVPSTGAVRTFTTNHPNEKNEDRWSEGVLRVDGTNIILVGVYDGHGGKETSTYISWAIPQTIARNMLQPTEESVESLLARSFQEVEASIIEPLVSHFKPFLRWFYTSTRRQQQIDNLLQSDVRMQEIALRARAGSTALVAYISQHTIYVANVGDCRAVIGRRNLGSHELTAFALTEDQDGSNPKEHQRVLSEHPVSEHDHLFVGGRLFGLTPITRSFGDSFYKLEDTNFSKYVFGSKQITLPLKLSYDSNFSPYYPFIQTSPYLTASPVITHYERSNLDRFMVIASDGLWGVKAATNDWVVQTVNQALMEGAEDPSQFLMQQLKQFHPGDDVTIKVIML